MSRIPQKHGHEVLTIANMKTADPQALLDYFRELAKASTPDKQLSARLGKNGEIILYVKNATPSLLYGLFFSDTIKRRAERAFRVVAEVMNRKDASPDAQQVMEHLKKSYTNRTSLQAGLSVPIPVSNTPNLPKNSTKFFSDWKIPASAALIQFAKAKPDSLNNLPLPDSLKNKNEVVKDFQAFVANGMQRRSLDTAGKATNPDSIREFARAWGAMDDAQRDNLKQDRTDKTSSNDSKMFDAIDHVVKMVCRAEDIDHPVLKKFFVNGIENTRGITAFRLISKLRHNDSTYVETATAWAKEYGNHLKNAWLRNDSKLPVDFPTREKEIKAAIRNKMDKDMNAQLTKATDKDKLLAAWALVREQFVTTACETALDAYCDAKLGQGDLAFKSVKVRHYSDRKPDQEGGFGRVHFGKLGKDSVAVKTLSAPSHEAHLPAAVKKTRREFVKEMRALSRLKETHQTNQKSSITEFKGMTFKDGAPGMVFEAHPLGTLDTSLSKASTSGNAAPTIRQLNPLGTLAVRQYMMQQMAMGLRKTHQASLIHGDIKTANYLVTDDGQLALCDFGTAQPADEGLVYDKLVQNALWAAPETMAISQQGNGDPYKGYTEITQKSDIWSLGVIFLELATGKNPFDGGNSFKTTENILAYAAHKTSPDEREKTLGLDALATTDKKLADFIKSMLDPVPENRPSSKEVEDFFSTRQNNLADGTALLEFLQPPTPSTPNSSVQ